MRLSQSSVFSDLRQTLANRRVIRVVYVDVGSGAWIRSLDVLVAVTLLLLIKCDLNCLFLKQSRFDIIALLFIDRVLTRSRITQVGLLSERCIQLVFPEVASHGCTHEWVRILSAARCGTCPELGVIQRSVHSAGFTGGGCGENVCVVSGARLVILDLRILAVGYLGEEDARLPLRIESFLLLGYLNVVVIVNAWAWVFSRWVLLILNFDGRLEDFSLVL